MEEFDTLLRPLIYGSAHLDRPVENRSRSRTLDTSVNVATGSRIPHLPIDADYILVVLLKTGGDIITALYERNVKTATRRGINIP